VSPPRTPKLPSESPPR